MKTTTKGLNRLVKMKATALAALAFATLASTAVMVRENDNDGDDFKFDLIRSKGLANFPTVAPNAHGRVKIESVGPVEIMMLGVGRGRGSAASDCFLLQLPN